MAAYKSIEYEYSEEHRVLEFDETANGIFDFETSITKVSYLIELIGYIQPRYVIIANCYIPEKKLYNIGSELFAKPIIDHGVCKIFLHVTKEQFGNLQNDEFIKSIDCISVFSSIQAIYSYIMGNK